MDPAREEALALAKGKEATAKAIEAVAKATTPEAARWAFTQWELRRRAKAKFGHADRMLFTREALEQATHERVAAYHALRFPPAVTVADLTCGIGADLIALARRGPAIGYEIDPERAELARHNLAVAGVEAEIRELDCLSAKWDFHFAFADPSRRVGGRRTLAPEDFAPRAEDLAQKMAALQLGGLKLSPMLADPFIEELGRAIEFIGHAGECPEALVWTGEQATAGRGAVDVTSGSRIEASEDPGPSEDDPAEYLYEAHPAAIRAHCLGTLCRGLGLAQLGDSNGYLTGSDLVQDPWLTGYRVLAHGRPDLGETRRTLESLGGRAYAVKSRAGIDVEALRRGLKTAGRRNLVVAVYPVAKALRHVVLEALAGSDRTFA